MKNNKCTNRFKIRFMRPEETGRLAELIGALQSYQNLSGVKRIPSEREITEDLTHVTADGCRVGNNYGSFVGLAIDTIKLDDTRSRSYIVGYIIYTQAYSIMKGRHLYMNSLFIQKEYRFHGLGKYLIGFMRAHGEILCNNYFDVPFMLNNEIGIKFYKKMGAYLVGEEYNLACLKGNQLETFNAEGS